MEYFVVSKNDDDSNVNDIKQKHGLKFGIL